MSKPKGNKSKTKRQKTTHGKSKLLSQQERFRERYSNLIDSCGDVVSLMDLNFNRVLVNKTYHQDLGYPPSDDDSIEVRFSRVHPHDLADLKQNLDVVKAKGKAECEYRIRHNDGHWLYRQAKMVVVMDEKDRPEAILSIIRDITGRKQIEDRLVAAKEQYRLVTDTATDGILTINSESIILFANPAIGDIFGHRPKELIGTNLIRLIPEHLRCVHLGGLAQYLKTRQRGTCWKAVQVMGLHRDGHEIPLEISFGEGTNNRMATFTGIVRDVSSRVEAEQRLMQAKKEAEKYLDISQALIVGLDLEGRISVINRRGCQVLGYKASELIGKDWFNTVMTERSREQARRGFYNVIRGKRELTSEREEVIVTKSGKELTFVWHHTIQRDEDGRITGSLSSGQDISDLKRAQRQLEHSATHDSLTGLANRRLFMERLRHGLALTRRAKGNLAILFIDLNRFKAVNDTYGHKTGDVLLKLVGERLVLSVRQTDTVARFGGDEYLVLLLNPKPLEGISNKILKEITRHYKVDGQKMSIGASIGVSEYPHDGHDPEELLKVADQAMYHMKARGIDGILFARDTKKKATSQP